MQIVTGQDASYDEDRALFNSMVDKRPAVIAKCGSPQDVVDALALATEEACAAAVATSAWRPRSRSGCTGSARRSLPV